MTDQLETRRWPLAAAMTPEATPHPSPLPMGEGAIAARLLTPAPFSLGEKVGMRGGAKLRCIQATLKRL